jgi:hypothetical protein
VTVLAPGTLIDGLPETDDKCHLLGSTRLVNSMTAFASCGGLGEAASWLSLRQDLYVALTLNKPLNIHLKNYELSQSFYSTDDAAWANRIVHTFARILSTAFRGTPVMKKEEWDELNSAAQAWHSNKPETFEPVYMESSGYSSGSSFPSVWLLQPAHVVGWQYFHLAKILLAIYDPRLPKLGLGSFKARKDAEVAANLPCIPG